MSDEHRAETDPRTTVRDGYDAISDRYTAWASADMSPGRLHALALVHDLVAEGGRVLDLGCGAAVPMTRALADRYVVHGVDISERQVEAAWRNVRRATFEHADIVELTLPESSFDAVVAFYSLTHIPREHHAGLLTRIHGWLRPGGALIASFGTRDDPGTVESDWLGAPMYFSHFDSATNVALVEAASFEIVSADTVVEPEDDGPAPFLWIAARRPQG